MRQLASVTIVVQNNLESNLSQCAPFFGRACGAGFIASLQLAPATFTWPRSNEAAIDNDSQFDFVSQNL